MNQARKAQMLRAELGKHFPGFPQHGQYIPGRKTIGDEDWEEWFTEISLYQKQEKDKPKAPPASSRPARHNNTNNSESPLNDDRFTKTLAACRAQARWKRDWKRNGRKGGSQEGEETATEQESVDSHGITQSTAPHRKAIPQPPRPDPLPPCLQCVQAGVCCSLTTSQYARSFARGLETNTTKKQALEALTMSLAEYNKASAALVQLSRQIDNNRHTLDENEFDAFQQEGIRLTDTKNKLQQRLLRDAIVAGETDSPLLTLPPMQCARCHRNRISGCLQQSRDLTGTTAPLDKIDGDRTLKGTESEAAKSVAPTMVGWFASSGPPPKSLLGQHCLSLRDQIMNNQTRNKAKNKQDSKKKKKKNGPPMLVEAVFCRDPTAMTAAEVAVRAQSLLQDISARNANKTDSTGSTITWTKPAAASDVAALMAYGHRTKNAAAAFPDLNVYTGQGIATAAVRYRNARTSWFDTGKREGGIFGGFGGFGGFTGLGAGRPGGTGGAGTVAGTSGTVVAGPPPRRGAATTTSSRALAFAARSPNNSNTQQANSDTAPTTPITTFIDHVFSHSSSMNHYQNADGEIFDGSIPDKDQDSPSPHKRQRLEYIGTIEQDRGSRSLLRAQLARWRQRGGHKREGITEEDPMFQAMENERLASLKRRQAFEQPLSSSSDETSVHEQHAPRDSTSYSSRSAGSGSTDLDGSPESDRGGRATENDDHKYPVLSKAGLAELLDQLLEAMLRGTKGPLNDEENDADDEAEEGEEEDGGGDDDESEDCMPSPPSTPKALIIQPSLEALERFVNARRSSPPGIFSHESNSGPRFRRPLSQYLWEHENTTPSPTSRARADPASTGLVPRTLADEVEEEE